jgi:sugar/nucleoside kinase (ribokinase family)
VPPSSTPAILCAGIAVQDIIFRVDTFPPPGGKRMTHDLVTVAGGCAVNAAIAVARLGGRARYAGPLGDLTDNASNQLMAAMAHEAIDTAAWCAWPALPPRFRGSWWMRPASG